MKANTMSHWPYGEPRSGPRMSSVTSLVPMALAPWQRYLVLGLTLLLGVAPLRTADAVLRVVTTVAPVTDLVRQVGGDVIHLHSLVPAGVSSHTFHPTPGDVQYLAQADLVILNGLNLEAGVEKLWRCCGNPRAMLLKLADQTVPQDEWITASAVAAQGTANPHLWVDVDYARRYVELIRDRLCALDPAHAERYRDHAARTLDTLTHLDRCIARVIATIPAEQRLLVTYHDAWPYFARRYGLTVVKVVQPSNFAEPSPREVARVVDLLRQSQVPAIFSSEIFPSAVPEKIAREAGVPRVEVLYDEILPGAVGESQHSYQGMMQRNVTTIVAALGGNPLAFEACLQERPAR
jgi:ABC-type Zn uptake system ZnuABC Zn-binding protein ZnuA